MKTLQDLVVAHKIVLLRVDYNVPLEDGQVADTARIEETKPTIEYLRKQGAKIVIMAHFGRPKGQINEALRFKSIVPIISQVLGVPVHYVSEAVGDQARQRIAALQAGEVLLLENIRFYPGEEANDPEFAKALAALGEVYVNDAFGAAHRAHASTAGVAAYLPHAAGLLMEREVTELTKVLEQPAQPLVGIIGGAKISTKLALIQNLLPKVDTLLLGGALANTLLLAQGKPVGKSLVEADLAKNIGELLSEKLLIPTDVVVAKDMKTGAGRRVTSVDAIAADEMILDIGPITAERYGQQIATAQTILWNGPMGIFEMEAFAQGTQAVAQAVADSNAHSVLGGGETVSAIHQMRLADKVSFISTGGGAMLEFMEGKQLPGIVALS